MNKDYLQYRQEVEKMFIDKYGSLSDMGISIKKNLDSVCGAYLQFEILQELKKLNEAMSKQEEVVVKAEGVEKPTTSRATKSTK